MSAFPARKSVVTGKIRKIRTANSLVFRGLGDARSLAWST